MRCVCIFLLHDHHRARRESRDIARNAAPNALIDSAVAGEPDDDHVEIVVFAEIDNAIDRVACDYVRGQFHPAGSSKFPGFFAELLKVSVFQALHFIELTYRSHILGQINFYGNGVEFSLEAKSQFYSSFQRFARTL